MFIHDKRRFAHLSVREISEFLVCVKLICTHMRNAQGTKNSSIHRSGFLKSVCPRGIGFVAIFQKCVNYLSCR